MDEAGKRAALSAVLIIGLGLAITLPQLTKDDEPVPVPTFAPSKTTMQTAKQEPVGKEEIFPSCEFKPMPCIERVGRDAFLFESVPGQPAKQTPVLILSTVPGGYKIVRQ